MDRRCELFKIDAAHASLPAAFFLCLMKVRAACNQRTCSCCCYFSCYCCCSCCLPACPPACCYCCKLFMHFEVYLKHTSKCSRISFQGIFQILLLVLLLLFFSRISASHLLFVDFMYCFSCFTWLVWEWEWKRAPGWVLLPCGHIWSP